MQLYSSTDNAAIINNILT